MWDLVGRTFTHDILFQYQVLDGWGNDNSYRDFGAGMPPATV